MAKAGSRDRKLRIPLVPGIPREVFQRWLVDPFVAQYGIEAETPDRPEVLLPLVRQHVSTGEIGYDVVEWSQPDFTLAKRYGLCEKLRPTNLRNLSQVYDRFIDPDGYGVGVFLWAMVLVFNPTKVSRGLTSWAELWNPEFRGVVSVRNQLTPSYIMAIVCRVLGTEERALKTSRGMEAAWKKLEELRGQVKIWWESEAHMQALAERGDIWVGQQYNDNAQVQKDRGVAIEAVYPVEGGIAGFRHWTVVKGSPLRDEAEAFIDFTLDVPQQRALAVHFYGGPINRNVVIEPSLARQIYGEGGPEGSRLPEWDWYLDDPAGLEHRWRRLLSR